MGKVAQLKELALKLLFSTRDKHGKAGSHGPTKGKKQYTRKNKHKHKEE